MSEVLDARKPGVEDDAARVIDALQDGQVAIVPLDVAYAICATRAAGMRAIFAAKQRSYEKPSGLFATWQMSRKIHEMPAEHHAIAQVIVEEYDLPFSIVAPFRADHPLFAGTDPFVLEHSSKAGTMDMLINAGAWHGAIARQSYARGIAVFGSSANRSLSGSKFRLGDIEPEVRAAAGIAIDGGTAKYANAEGRSSTIIDFRDFRLLRRGVRCAELETIFRDRFGIVLSD